MSGGGKETPRQKLIGMMYLVFLAMVAINVSADVLNAFVVVDEGLTATLQTLDEANERVVSQFEEQMEINPVRVGPYFEKAKKVREEADHIVHKILEYKKEIVVASDGEDSEALTDHGVNIAGLTAKDPVDPPFRIMVGDNQDKGGKDIQDMFAHYMDILIHDIIDNEHAEATNNAIIASLTTENGHGDGHGDDGHGSGHASSGGHESWITSHFSHLPIAGVLSIMSGLQINVRNAESAALRYLYTQIDAGSFKFNRLESTVIANSNYVIKGNEYIADVFLAASDTNAAPKIYWTENSRPYDSVFENNTWKYSLREDIRYDSMTVVGGKGKLIRPAQRLGETTWGGIIEITGPSGDPIRKPFKQNYMIAEGSFSVAATKMNVFYAAVENPVDVSVAGVPPEMIDIDVTNASKKKKGSSYIITPRRPGNSMVHVFATIDGKRQKVGSSPFRVKIVPKPIAKLASRTGGRINKNILMQQIALQAEMEDFDFDLTDKITQFTVSASVNGFVREASSKTNRITKDQKAIFESLSRGTAVFFTDIKAVGPDGTPRDISTINFTIN